MPLGWRTAVSATAARPGWRWWSLPRCWRLCWPANDRPVVVQVTPSPLGAILHVIGIRDSSFCGSSRREACKQAVNALIDLHVLKARSPLKPVLNLLPRDASAAEAEDANRNQIASSTPLPPGRPAAARGMHCCRGRHHGPGYGAIGCPGRRRCDQRRRQLRVRPYLHLPPCKLSAKRSCTGGIQVERLPINYLNSSSGAVVRVELHEESGDLAVAHEGYVSALKARGEAADVLQLSRRGLRSKPHNADG